MKRQRGNIYVIAVLAIVVLGMLYAAYKIVDANWATTAGVDKGKADIRLKWDEANRLAQEEADKIRRDREAEGRRHAAELATANQTAADFEAKWRKDRAANRKPLATIECPAGPAGIPQPVLADSAPATAGGVRLRLSDQFLREYDGAWTGKDGKPVFGDPGGSAEAAGATVGLEALLGTHGENAVRCSGNARQMNKLIDFLIKLRGGTP